MIEKMDLFEFMAYKLSCDYISDLRFLSKAQRERLALTIERETGDADATLFEWNDALSYLSSRHPEDNVYKARQELIKSLRNQGSV